jgi:hypothetical protein
MFRKLPSRGVNLIRMSGSISFFALLSSPFELIEFKLTLFIWFRFEPGLSIVQRWVLSIESKCWSLRMRNLVIVLSEWNSLVYRSMRLRQFPLDIRSWWKVFNWDIWLVTYWWCHFGRLIKVRLCLIQV